jgi:hypothetical protein
MIEQPTPRCERVHDGRSLFPDERVPHARATRTRFRSARRQRLSRHSWSRRRPWWHTGRYPTQSWLRRARRTRSREGQRGLSARPSRPLQCRGRGRWCREGQRTRNRSLERIVQLWDAWPGWPDCI